jgi:hypothetical protein
MTRSSEQLERDAEQVRAQIAGTLDELRNRLTPGQVVDELVDYGRETNVGELVRNLGRDVRGNPLPLLLIGAGIAWTIMGSGRSRQQPRSSAGFGSAAVDTASTVMSGARETGTGLADATRRTSADLTDQARETISRTREMGSGVADATRRTAADLVDQASETAANLRTRAQSGTAAMGDAASEAQWRLAQTGGAIGEAASSLRDTASARLENATEAARDAAASVRETAQSFGRNAATQSRTIVDFCRDQPLVLAGLGLALGAAIGALLPSSETEDRLVGEASDEMKERAREFAAEQYDKAKNVASAAYQEARAQAEREGLGDVHAQEASVVPAEPRETTTASKSVHHEQTEPAHGPH